MKTDAGETFALVLIGVAVTVLRGGRAADAVAVVTAVERAGEQLAVHFTPYDRRDMAGVIEEAVGVTERGAFELSRTRGRAMSVRDAALVAVEGLKLAMQANATADPVARVLA